MDRRKIAVFGVAAGLGIGAGVAAIPRPAGAAGDAGGLRRTPVVEAVGRAAPAVVNISTSSASRGWYGGSRGSGSGVIVHPQGYVVTNSHVVRGASQIVVQTSRALDGRNRNLPARLVEDDPSRDLALLRIQAEGRSYPFVPLAESSEVMVGETAIAIGNPYGLGDSVTVGIVSALGRDATIPSGLTLRGLLQTDASINFGNSGGALLNLDGNLIGINCSVHPQATGIAFTIPADQVRRMLERNCGVTKSGSAAPPAPEAGKAAPAPTPPAAAAPKPSTDPRPGVGLLLKSDARGVLVAGIATGSAAEAAGLQVGDVILELDGKPAPIASECARTLSTAARGRAFALQVQRGSVRHRFVVVVPPA